MWACRTLAHGLARPAPCAPACEVQQPGEMEKHDIGRVVHQFRLDENLFRAVRLRIRLVPQLVFSDVVVLRDGTHIEGTLANREHIAVNPEHYEFISILIDKTAEFRRILTANIQYVLLVDAGEQRVIDFYSVSAGPVMPRPIGTEQKNESGKRDLGIGMMICGGGIGLVGALVKFGDEKLVVTTTDVKYDENSYNTYNYILMAGGGLMFVLGLIWASEPSERTDRVDHAVIEFGKHETRIGLIFEF